MKGAIVTNVRFQSLENLSRRECAPRIFKIVTARKNLRLDSASGRCGSHREFCAGNQDVQNLALEGLRRLDNFWMFLVSMSQFRHQELLVLFFSK